MSKIKIRYSVKNSNETISNECLGILNDNRITYNDNGVMTIINIDLLELSRTTNEYEIKMLFNDNICYVINDEGTLNIDLELKTKKIDKNKIYIEYILSNEIYYYELEYEVI